MLILTRRIGEAITIGDDVKVTVLGINGSQVRIGVTAPKLNIRKPSERSDARPG